jgi:hypothetical protein
MSLLRRLRTGWGLTPWRDWRPLATLAAALVVAACASPPAEAEKPAADAAAPHAAAAGAFSASTYWDDGLSEMAYYDATDVIYGQSRSYTRVHLTNREWFDEVTGVKAESQLDQHTPVLKMNIAEEIATENYNYRYLTMLFARRDTLRPLKMVVSSQEWCGATFKHLRWMGAALVVKSFSYFPGEGDAETTLPRDTHALESLFLTVRNVTLLGAEGSTPIRLLPPLRTSHAAATEAADARLVVDAPRTIKVPLGRFEATRVRVEWSGAEAWFDVETAAPHRILAFQAGTTAGQLRSVEKRAYWDREKRSEFYKPGAAP